MGRVMAKRGDCVLPARERFRDAGAVKQCPRRTLELCGTLHPAYDHIHFETFSILKQYSTNDFMNGEDAKTAGSVDFKWKKS
jgi:hypothetical protein